ncbi:MAG TPA: multicopper oxidase domain-containing protein, partial [Thermoanaerobaculia bacterium]
PRRYRFRLLDGSNARMYRMQFGGAKVYQIGADDNYLDKPVPVSEVFLAPAERADVIIDFSQLAGKTVFVTNDAPVPFPSGLVPQIDQPGMVNVMQFRVSAKKVSDSTCNPVGDCRRPVPIPRLAINGQIDSAVKVDKVRRLALKEHEGPGGPLEVLLNNTHFDGLAPDGLIAPNLLAFGDGPSEKPVIGSTELWEILNLTMDAHPIHTHLVQFQILNRQSIDVDGTMGSPGGAFGYVGFDDGINPPIPGVWAQAFATIERTKPCELADPLNPCPAFGPPLLYDKGDTITLPNGQIVPLVGGNPDVTPFLLNDAAAPAANEAGWKDTVKTMPGQVTRILVRWAPTTTRTGTTIPGVNLYPFDPTQGPGYMWHCHILDHEDNDMMRPYVVVK